MIGRQERVASMDDALVIRNLCKTYPKSKFSLMDVSFSFPRGNIMGFVGENGSGKTTTINCIMGTRFKDSGQIKILGRDIDAETHRSREDVAVVYDSEYSMEKLNPIQLESVFQNLHPSWSHAMYDEYLERFDIPKKQPVKSFSKGMNAKFRLIAALSQQPELLILDEPTSGLDPVVKEEVLNLFLEFVEDERHSILFSTHITTDLERIADYITFIHDGKIIDSLEKDDIMDNYGIGRLTREQFSNLEDRYKSNVLKKEHEINILVTDKAGFGMEYPDYALDPISLDEMLTLLVKGVNYEK